MSKPKKYTISAEVFKYPYCGKSIESEEFLSEKICKIRKKIVTKTKRAFVYGPVFGPVFGPAPNQLAPNQAIGLPILTINK